MLTISEIILIISSIIFEIVTRYLINLDTKSYETKQNKFKIGLLTNELPPIVYGGVATWIVNFIEMFKNDDTYKIIPIFLAYQDDLPIKTINKYKNIRIIKYQHDIDTIFKDINICVNNLWIAVDAIEYIKDKFPDLKLITVCHSLIQMELITNMNYTYTNKFNDQEITFKLSDHVVLISEAERNYYNKFGYNILNNNTSVIYNSYKPKFDNNFDSNNTNSNVLGYIGRHVPRKRPEIPIKSIEYLKLDNLVINMGVDYDKYDNYYWREMETKYDNLMIIPFTSNVAKKKLFWDSTGIVCITGIYEPFGYTTCEAIDRGKFCIICNIDGPKEIIKGFEKYAFLYNVDKNNYTNEDAGWYAIKHDNLEICQDQCPYYL